jgi:hypothetical protein
VAFGAGAVHIAGGFGPSGQSAAIERYDPATDTIGPGSASLPVPRASPSALWDGGGLLLFGGCTTACATDEVLRYDPAAGTVVVAGHLPSARYASSAAWDGARALVIGGIRPSPLRETDQVVAFDPATGTSIIAGPLPTPRGWTAAAALGDSVYVLGGCAPPPERCPRADVVRYAARLPGAPRDLQLERGPGRGEISLAWSPPPAAETPEPVVGYRLYHRGVFDLEDLFLADVGPSTTFLATGLQDGEQQTYRVAARTAAGVGSLSLAMTGRAPSWPGPPSYLAASPGPGRGEVGLAWSAPADDGGSEVVGYRVWRGTTPESIARVAELGVMLAWTDQGLPDATTFLYRIQAVNALGGGSLSPLASTTTLGPPGPPRDLTAGTQFHASLQGVGLVVRLTWAPPAIPANPPLDGYEVLRGPAPGQESPLASVSESTYADDTCPLPMRCYYVVRAVNSIGPGPASNEVSALGTALPR